MGIKFGSHVQFKNQKKDESYLAGAAKEALSYGATAMMIYLGPPQNSRRIAVEKMEKDIYEKKYEKLLPKDNILIHGPYIINPSSLEKYGFAIEYLKQEAARMNYLGIKYLVIHPGASTKFSREKSLETLVKTLKEVIAETKDIVICLETMSGKGTEVGTTFDEIRWIYEQVGSKRLGVCLDICHAWDAGYDVNNYDEFIKSLKDAKIYDLIYAIHVNDSKNPMNSHKDRHANIGTGFIKLDVIRKIVTGPDFPNAIKILETPYVDDKPIYKKEIQLIRN